MTEVRYSFGAQQLNNSCTRFGSQLVANLSQSRSSMSTARTVIIFLLAWAIKSTISGNPHSIDYEMCKSQPITAVVKRSPSKTDILVFFGDYYSRVDLSDPFWPHIRRNYPRKISGPLDNPNGTYHFFKEHQQVVGAYISGENIHHLVTPSLEYKFTINFEGHVFSNGTPSANVNNVVGRTQFNSGEDTKSYKFMVKNGKKIVEAKSFSSTTSKTTTADFDNIDVLPFFPTAVVAVKDPLTNTSKGYFFNNTSAFAFELNPTSFDKGDLGEFNFNVTKNKIIYPQELFKGCETLLVLTTPKMEEVLAKKYAFPPGAAIVITILGMFLILAIAAYCAARKAKKARARFEDLSKRRRSH